MSRKKQEKWRTAATLCAVVGIAVLFGGCENTAETVDQAVKKTGEGLKSVGSDMEQAASPEDGPSIGQKVEEKVDQVVDKASQLGDKAKEAAGKLSETAVQAKDEIKQAATKIKDKIRGDVEAEEAVENNQSQ